MDQISLDLETLLGDQKEHYIIDNGFPESIDLDLLTLLTYGVKVMVINSRYVIPQQKHLKPP